MRSLTLALALALVAVTFVANAATVAPPEEGNPAPILCVGWGRTFAEAEQKAYQKAEAYYPYKEVDKQFGWDPTHIPHNYQYYCMLWIVPEEPENCEPA